MKKLFIVVDMQEDFVRGALGSKEAQALIPNLRKRLSMAQENGEEIAFTQDTHTADYLNTQEGQRLPVSHCIKDTAGWEIVKELPTAGARIFEKPTFGSLELARFVRENGYEEVALCGVCTDICVVSNALLIKAFCPEIPVRVEEKLCAGTSRAAHDCAVQTMKSCQIVIE